MAEKKHSHNFVDQYDGMVAFGFSRSINENSIIYYLQKFSDDVLMQTLVPRLTDGEIEELFEIIVRLLKNHLSDEEYHDLFLKD